MDPVLIYIDEERMSQEKEALNKAILFLQALYDAFKDIGLVVTTRDLSSLPHLVSPRNEWYQEKLVKFVKDKLLDKAGSPDFNGVQFNRSLLEAHIAMPDLTTLENILKEYRDSRTRNANGDPLAIRENLIDFVNEVYSKKAIADNALETEFSYYTKSDFGATLAGRLNAICASLNSFADVYPPGQYGEGWGLHYSNGVPIPGITVRQETFIPDLGFIRSKEELHG